jgi:TRAP-type C4-dicarboxylate transport system permease small subunit
MFRKAVYRISAVAHAGATLILAALCIAVLYDVTMRYLFNAPTQWGVEYTGYGIAWLGLLGAADVLRRNGHVGIYLLADRLSEVWRVRLFRFANLIVFAVAAGLLIAGSAWVAQTFRL